MMENENRKKAVRRTQKLVYYFAKMMLEEEAVEKQEKEEFERRRAAGEQVLMISSAANNIRCMHDCMKASVEVAEFLRNADNDVDEWQLAGINAMYDFCNVMEEGGVVIPFDLPYAIKGILLQWDDSETKESTNENSNE